MENSGIRYINDAFSQQALIKETLLNPVEIKLKKFLRLLLTMILSTGKNWLIFFLLTICTILLSSCGTNQRGCPFCTSDLQEDRVVSPSTPLKGLYMKWVALPGAPSISNPSLVCEDDFKDVLFRRHIRAASCIWIPQCRIALTPAFSPDSNYGIIQDQDLSIGQPGDVVINADTLFSSEILDTFNVADAYWNGQPSGVTAIAIRRFINPDGTNINIGGLGFANSGTRPGLFIIDPEFLPHLHHEEHVGAEQILAHELDHVLGLCHPDEGDCNQINANSEISNLMLANSNGLNKKLTESQCEIARNLYPHLFTDGREHVIVGHIMDTPDTNLINKNMGYIDLHKIVMFDGSPHQGNLKFLLGTNGLFQEKKATYWLVLDTDNNESTGLRAIEVIAGSKQSGIELIVKITVDENKIAKAEIFKAKKSSFSPLNLPKNFLKAQLNTIKAYGYTNVNQPFKPIPLFEELEIEISAEAFQELSLPGQGKPAFPNGLKMQAISEGFSSDGKVFSDSCPDIPGLMNFSKENTLR